MTQPSNNVEEPRSRRSSAGFGIVLSLFIASAAAITSYWSWQQSNMRDEVQIRLESGMTKLLNGISGQREDIGRRLAADLEQRNNYNALQQHLTALESILARSNPPPQGDHWTLAEINYLINIAEHQYRLAQSNAMARSSLERAQQLLLKESPSAPATISVEIAHLITQLSGSQNQNRAQQLGRLDDLAALIPQLPIAKNRGAIEKNRDISDYSLGSTEGWRHYGAALWHDIQQLFRIRHPDATEGKKRTPITADIYPLLRQQLALKIDFARLSLIGNSPFYQSSVKDIQHIVDNYLDSSSEVVKAQRTILAQMVATDAGDPAYIDFTKVRQMVADHLTTGGGD